MNDYSNKKIKIKNRKKEKFKLSVKMLLRKYSILNILDTLSSRKWHVYNYYSDIVKIPEYKVIRIYYDKIVDDLAEYCRYLGATTPMDVFYIFNYLYLNGFLSFKGSFEYSVSHEYDFLDMRGVSVICGRGCCRHITPFLNDVCKKFGFESSVLDVFEKDECKTINDYFEDICETEGDSSAILNDYLYAVREKYFGNHLIVSVIYNGKVYLLDPTNGELIGKYKGKFYYLVKEENEKTIEKKEFASFEEFAIKYELSTMKMYMVNWKILLKTIFGKFCQEGEYICEYNQSFEKLQSVLIDKSPMFFETHKNMYESIMVLSDVLSCKVETLNRERSTENLKVLK